MSKFRSWGLTVVTMASVATVVLLVTGWGSALAANVSSVIVANTPSSPAQVHEAGTANVNVTNTTAIPVNAKNLTTDGSGNLKVAEQGTPNVNVTNTDSNGDIKVHEQGTADVNVTNLPTTQTVDGTVNVANLPSLQTQTLNTGSDLVALGAEDFLLGDFGTPVDTTAYKEITVYGIFHAGSDPAPSGTIDCRFLTAFSNGDNFLVADVQNSGDQLLQTLKPAPPNLEIFCRNNTGVVAQYDFMVFARPN